MTDILKRLYDKDNKAAYETAKQIGAESALTDRYLALIPAFAEMLQAKNAFVRTRGFVLICNQARWADNGQIAAVLDEMIPLLNDPKPTVVRQCLAALHEVALFRPELSGRIEKALAEMEICRYQDTMLPLIEKDAAALRNLL